MSRAEIECALAEISLHPPKRAIRNWVSIVTTVITRQREERGAMPVAVSPVDAEAEAQARWERDKAERDRKNAEVSKKLPPEARAAAAAVVAEAKQREAANGKAQG